MPSHDQKSGRRAPNRAVRDVDRSFRTTFGERLRTVADLFDSRAEASEVAGVVPEQLQKYIRGAVKPPFEVIRRLAAAKAISLDWLATGEGEMRIADHELGGDWVL